MSPTTLLERERGRKKHFRVYEEAPGFRPGPRDHVIGTHHNPGCLSVERSFFLETHGIV